MKQIGLFTDAPEAPDHGDRELADRLPARIHLGPSSWTFTGWEGIVYPRGVTREALVERGLSLIAQNPLMRTVGIDRSHYAPLSEGELRHYAAQLPPGYPCVMKAWSAITTFADPRSGDLNRAFLDAAVCEREVLIPCARAFHDHVGALVFQMAPILPRALPHPEAFADRLHAFFGSLSTAFRYAVEIRNRELLTPAYLAVLAHHRVAHVLNLWERMPTVGEQLAVKGIFTAPFVVCRLSITPGGRYDDRKKSFAPFDKIVAPDESARADAAALARACEKLRRTLLLTVNNKVEGSSPLTIRALARRIVQGW